MEIIRSFSYLVVLVFVLTSGSPIECQYIRDVALDDVIDNIDVIRNTSARSMLECAKKCNINDVCFAFHFTQGSKQCVEKSNFSNASRGVPSTGAKYYQIDLGTPVCPIVGGDWVNATMLNNGTIEAYQIRVLSGSCNDKFEAVAGCQSFNATLPQVTTTDKLDYYVYNIVMICPGLDDDFFVDGSNIDAVDLYASDAYTTSTGDVLHLSSDIWAPNRPGSPDTQQCVLSQRSMNYKLNDKRCSYSSPLVICEKKLPSY